MYKVDLLNQGNVGLLCTYLREKEGMCPAWKGGVCGVERQWWGAWRFGKVTNLYRRSCMIVEYALGNI